MKATNFIFAAILVVTVAIAISAQTSAFTYQGRFTDGGTAANGTYEMQFKLFDGASNQVGSTVTNAAVVVSDGVFTVQLDYGSAAFSGADRFLEIGVRPAGSGNSFTVLSPRQQLTSAVYAIRSATADTATNTTQLGGVTAGQYVQTNDSRLTDARTPSAGSSNYIQNTNSQQVANFNISGSGTADTLSANVVTATTQYNIGHKRVLGVVNNNTFVGWDTATANLVGQNNSFFGYQAGSATTFGNANSFFGSFAGYINTTGSANSFFGNECGLNNTSGSDNSFFGYATGHNNDSGTDNAFFGYSAGELSKTGSNNSFFGANAGAFNISGVSNAFFGGNAGHNTTGSEDSFFGKSAGITNTSGLFNTLIGFSADVGSGNLLNATAIGANSRVDQSNSLVLGAINGVNGGSDTNVGIGTTAPNARFHIAVNGGNVLMGNAGCGSGFTGIGFGASLTGCANYSLLGNGTDTIVNRPSGGGLFLRENNVTQMMIATGGAVTVSSTLVVGTLGAAGSTSLCRNASNQISTCSSSLRYKKDLRPFTRGLSLLNQLKPLTFKWKSDNSADLGFGAEDIAAVEPLLVTRNDKGQVEGVKYDRITAVLVNAVKEQQEEIKQQQTQIEMLKTLVCRRNRRAPVCK